MTDKQKQFIILRAENLSFDKISNNLKISKPTLIEWSKVLQKEIQNLQFESFIRIKEAYGFTIKNRYETALKDLNIIESQILVSDLSKISVKDLFTIRNSLLEQINSIEQKTMGNYDLDKLDLLGWSNESELKLNEI